MKVGVLLSGCGVYDGSEIHEATLSLLALDHLGVEVQCIAPDIEQHHVINHLTGAEIPEKRNVLIESARIARGKIQALNTVNSDDLDALLLAGGFGAAKNLSTWAFAGADSDILPDVKHLILTMVHAKKPIAALCIAPTVLAKALQGSDIHPQLTVGTTTAPSPYDITAINAGLNSIGAQTIMTTVDGIVIDKTNKIITSPCYMMEASIAQVFVGIEKTCTALIDLVRESTTP
ncbi:uncharacterized protein involved in an early stage of isoprenoid biosynthesis [Beggiatoa alba B18LD]|uniref:Uncharacterized protein involved in an early stage of isoprenoid biosynthesis n=1 Tax=Beggiatoa alba B18LD TaxID=395493 RepID=I3CCW1_9GAMM|nr:isoprenoid biosynthesis glyoxalase ElbB [Beggiatoa alba]EIJ41454.1 uncharacterized protein involved in an early stage of isoprenoid biosynthesis [Beggiatoa alba B18LD]